MNPDTMRIFAGRQTSPLDFTDAERLKPEILQIPLMELTSAIDCMKTDLTKGDLTSEKRISPVSDKLQELSSCKLSWMAGLISASSFHSELRLTTMSVPTVRHVIEVLERIASPYLAATWDNIGLLLGSPEMDAGRILTCLTLTSDVAQEAIETNAQLIVTHHPVLFKPVQKLTTQSVEGAILWNLARAGISVYSPHTAWDDAPTGINQQLAERLGLHAIQPLRVKPLSAALKIVTFVPENSLEIVAEAIWQAGAGTMGEYSRCSFFHAGTGTFQGSAATNPTVGTAGVFERAPEFRLEILSPKNRLETALKALRAAHPYEEPAIDVIPLEPWSGSWGSGRRGVLHQPETLKAFAERCRDVLKSGHVMVVGDGERLVTTVAIACGAAGEYLSDARRAGCDVFLTGETRFHTALEAREHHTGLVLAGHFATERFAMEALANRLQQEFPEANVSASQVEQDPIWFC